MAETVQKITLPRNLYLETTNRCNLRCRGCILYDRKREPERDITFQDMVNITGQLEALERITLHGVGEPFLNKDLPAMIRHLKKRNVYTLFNSNGILLGHERQLDLVDSGLDELRISLDAASAAGYKKIRGSNHFDRIVGNLRALINLQKARLQMQPRVSLWFLGTRDNIKELPEFVKLADQIGIGEVYLQRLVYYQDDSGYGVATQNKSLYDSDDRSRELIRESQELAGKLGVQFNASGLRQPLDSVNSDSAGEKPWSRCYRPQTLMYITANGNVLPCCIAPFATVDYQSIIMGNVYESSLLDIWRGPKYISFRQRLQTDEPQACCQGCGVFWSL